MPIHKNPDGTFQWGKSGKKYRSKKDAVKQMKAIFASGYTQGQTKTASGTVYKVGDKDTYGSIAKATGKPVSALQYWNNGKKLKAGDHLWVFSPKSASKWAPEKYVYRIKPGDTYASIAKNLKSNQADLQRWNGNTGLKAGQYLWRINPSNPAQYYKPSLQQLYSKLQNIQTGKNTSQLNRFIRTKQVPKEGSTAYGPLQLGKMIQKFPDLAHKSPQERKQLQEYIIKLRQQRTKFKKYGRNPHYLKRKGAIDPIGLTGYSKIWDYGGSGDSSLYNTPKARNTYKQVALAYLKPIYEKAIKHRTSDQFYREIAKGWHHATDTNKIDEYINKLKNN